MATENLETVSHGIGTATALQRWVANTRFEFEHSVSDECDQQLSELGVPSTSKFYCTLVDPKAEC